jgi:hypothetical protein
MKKLLLLLLFIPLVSFGQDIFEGTVVGLNDQLAGAIVLNNNNKDTTVSNNWGKFKIKAAIGDTLVVSFVGFKTNYFKVKRLKRVFIELKIDEEIEWVEVATGTNFDNKSSKFNVSSPIFPGCEKVAKSKKKDCFQKKLNKHISKYFKYPEEAQILGIQGKVFIQFMIEIDGNIGGIRTRGPSKIIEDEAKRIISLLPKMSPGTQRGRPIKVPFSTSITFRLN